MLGKFAPNITFIKIAIPNRPQTKKLRYLRKKNIMFVLSPLWNTVAVS